MSHWLVHPPFADPTQPYVSLPTLKGYLRAQRLDVRLLDLNVEAANWLLSSVTLHDFARRVEALWRNLDRKGSLSFAEQRQYRLAWDALPRIFAAAKATPGPLEVFHSRELFFDTATYERARHHAEAAFAALEVLAFPFRHGFNSSTHSVVPWSFDLLDSYSRNDGPLEDFYLRVFETGGASTPTHDALPRGDDGIPRLDMQDASFIGISVAFPSQIPEALALARRFRRIAPSAFLALGGPSIHQVAIHLDAEKRLRLLDYVDGIGLFEGEETLARLLPLIPEWQVSRDASILHDVPNLLLADGASSRIGPRWTADLREAPPPDFDGLDLDRYLAPSRTLLVAPTRGCYWNECSFCYYGLSETATAKYREVPPERLVAQLAKLARRHGVKDFYLSCDVLAPAYALRFAEALLARGLAIRWSSDLKIEKYFTAERCELLARAGLSAAAFGIESGSDRILKLMRKGVDRDTMTRVNRDFHAHGVATEWMTFTDHPGESPDEALATIRWIAEESEHVDLFIVGQFGLERGSAIYQDPQAFGVEEIFFTEGDELRLYAQWRGAGREHSPGQRRKIDEAVSELSRGWRLGSYPWAGANSTHHSLLHFLEQGQDAFKRDLDVPAQIEREMSRLAKVTHGKLKPRYSMAALTQQEDAFFAQYLRRALYTTIPERGAGPGHSVAPLSLSHFEEAASLVPEVVPVNR